MNRLRFLISFCLIWVGLGWGLYHAANQLGRRLGGEKCWVYYEDRCWDRWEWRGHLAQSISFWGKIDQVRERISEALKERDRWGVMRKLIINESSPAQTAEILRATGFVHLTSVAGIHLYALMAWIFFVAKIMGGYLGWNYNRAKCLGLILVIFTIGGLWLLEGARPGMLRPVGVIALRSAVRFLGYRWTWWAPLGVCLLADMGVGFFLSWKEGIEWDEWAPGRTHYALAVGGGLAAIEWVRSNSNNAGWRKIVREHFAMSVGSWACTAILDLWTMGMVAPWTPLVSLVTIPWFCTWAMPGILVSYLLEAKSCVNAWVEISDRFLDAIFMFVKDRGCLFWADPLGWGTIAGSVLAVVLWGRRKRLSGILVGVAVMFVLGVCTDRKSDGERLVQWDVGQGDLAWIRDEGKDRLIDVGSDQVMKLRGWGSFWKAVRPMNPEIYLTHLDRDHIGGLFELMRWVKLDRVHIFSKNLDSVRGVWIERFLNERNVGVREIDSGNDGALWWWMVEGRRSGQNDLGGGIAWVGKERCYFNFGDSSYRREEELLSEIPEAVRRECARRIKVLKVSHHGSRTSTRADWLRRLDVDCAWVSVGEENHYGHPTPEVLMVLKGGAAEVFRTDRHGDLEIKQSCLSKESNRPVNRVIRNYRLRGQRPRRKEILGQNEGTQLQSFEHQ